MVKTKCITMTDEQLHRLEALHIRTIQRENKNISFSKVVQRVIDEGLKTVR